MLAWANSPNAPIALAVLAFAESSFFPIPPDTLLVTLGLLQPETVLGLALLVTLASVCGGGVGYGIGRFGGRPVLLKLFDEQHILLVQALYQRYDVWAIFIAAFTPIPYKVFTISAGVFQLNVQRFMLASLIGRGGRFLLVGGAIALFGEQVQYFLTNYFELTIVAFTLLLIAGFLAMRLIFPRVVTKLVGSEHPSEAAPQRSATDDS